MVSVKRVIDPYVKVRLNADGSGVAPNKMTINPFDQIALEAAVQLKEAGIAQSVMAVSLGDESVTETLRLALASGADEAHHILTSTHYDSYNVASILGQLAKQQSAQLVLMGKRAIDGDNQQTPQMLAALLDWPCHLFASKITCDAESVQVHSEVDSGIAVTASALPAVISVDLRLNTPRYPSMPSILKAKRQPIETVEVEHLLSSPTDHMCVQSWETSPADRQGKRLASVQDLAQCLAEHMA